MLGIGWNRKEIVHFVTLNCDAPRNGSPVNGEPVCFVKNETIIPNNISGKSLPYNHRNSHTILLTAFSLEE
jgi:hypothetical protein